LPVGEQKTRSLSCHSLPAALCHDVIPSQGSRFLRTDAGHEAEDDRASMQKKFDELARRIPRFEERTSEILRAWDARFGDKAFDELLAGTHTVESVARLLGVSEEETRSRANAYRQAHSGE
jgi:hypothetical protein